MKKITLFFFMIAVSLGYSQQVLEDFEGAAPVLGFSNGPGSATIVADPAAGGVNGNVLEVITGAASAPWQQAELTLQGDWLDLTTNKTVDVDVYSLTAFDMLGRVQDGTGPVSATDASHTGSGWETLTFDFNVPKDGQQVANGIYPKIFFFNLWDSAAGGGAGGWVTANGASIVITSYVDNITAFAAPAPETCNDGILNNGETEIDCGGPNCDACPMVPTVAAPTPPQRLAADVISIYSDAYADIAVDTYDTPWCGATTSDVTIAGDATKLITGLGCEGVEFITGRFDSTGFGFFHMDIWTDSPTMDKSFNFKFSDWNGGASEAGAFEYSANNSNILPSTNPGTWISIDIPLASFNIINGVTGTDFVQFVITSDLGSVYYDNLYLHKNTVLSTTDVETAEFRAFPNPTNGDWNISSRSVINTVAVFDILGKQVITLTPNTTDVVVNASALNAGVYFARIDGVNGSKTIKLVKQ